MSLCAMGRNIFVSLCCESIKACGFDGVGGGDNEGRPARKRAERWCEHCWRKGIEYEKHVETEVAVCLGGSG